MATPGTDDVSGLKASEISELHRTAQWREPPEEIKEEDDLPTGEDMKLFQSVAARFNFLAMDRPDLLHSVEELMRQMVSPRAGDLIALKIAARFFNQVSTYGLQIPMDSTFGDANFAGCISSGKSTVGGVALWSGRFVKAWSKTVVILPLSGGESELVAVVRAATEGTGLQSILSDFGSVLVMWGATAAIGMVHRLELGKVRHLAVGVLWVQHHVRLGKIRVSNMSGFENPSDAQTKYFGPESLLRHTKGCNWVLVEG